jgi:hypothetical protein
MVFDTVELYQSSSLPTVGLHLHPQNKPCLTLLHIRNEGGKYPDLRALVGAVKEE